MASEMLERIFSSGSGGCERTCVCGRLHFDSSGQWDFDDEEELGRHEEKADKEPDKYIRQNGSIGTMLIPFVGEVVYDCPCGLAEKFERLLRDNAVTIARYLNAYSRMLREASERTEVKGFEDG